MNKWFAIGFVAVFASAAYAADSTGMRKGSYGMAGCGLGSMVWESNTMGNQILAATTNGTSGTQTFGISSGTSNCTKGGVSRLGKAQELFVTMNFESLSNDMARGNGETLAAFSQLLGCQDASKFGKATQSKYESVLSKSSTGEELLLNVKSDSDIARACRS